MTDLALTISSVARPLLVSGGYCLGVLAFGLCCLSALSLSRSQCRDIPLSLYLGIAGALGSGLIATVWLILSLTGQFRFPVVTGFLAAFVLLATFAIRPSLPQIGIAAQDTAREFLAENSPWKFVTLATAVLVIIHGVSALHPAIGDSVAFYLPWSRVIADTGRVIRLPGYESFSDIWTIAEIQVAALMMMSDDFAARALPFWHAILSAILLWGAGRLIGVDFRTRMLAVAMLFTSSAVTYIVWDGKTDLIALPLGLAALIMAVLLADRQDKRYSIVTGLLLGTAIAAKLSYIPILGIAVIALSAWKISRQSRLNPRDWLRHSANEFYSLLTIGLAVVIVLAPQMARNWLLTGEPFAPLYYFHNVSFGLEQSWFTPETTLRIVLTYPFALVFGNYWGQHGNVSVLALAFAPLGLFFLRDQSRTFWLLALAAVSGLLIWMILRPSTLAPRYILCSLIAGYLFAAAAAARASLTGTRAIKIMIWCMTVYIVVTSANSLRTVAAQSVAYARNGDIETPANDEVFAAMRVLNSRAEAGTRISLLSYNRYPLRADLLQCATGGQDFVKGAPRTLMDHYVKGARFIVIDPVAYKEDMRRVLTEIPPWADMTLIYDSSSMLVYELTGRASAPPVEFKCTKQGTLWQRTAVR